MKIAILGAGNAGCISALHFQHFGRAHGVEIDIYHSPVEHPMEKVGQGTTLAPLLYFESILGTNWYNNNIGATFKSGILYENWGKKNDKIFHPFTKDAMSMHYVPSLLSKAVLESGVYNVIEKTINDPESEVDADWIIDCRGKDRKGEIEYLPLKNPLNSALLYRKAGRDPDLHYTRTVATPNGWAFVIPNQDSVSYGYLYNDTITSTQVARADFLERFDLPETDGSNLKFDNYIAKDVCVGDRTILNGNRCAFLEPLEATSTAFYQKVCQVAWDYINQVDNIQGTSVHGHSHKPLLPTRADKEYMNDHIHGAMQQVETFVLWHYQNGSKFDTPFWEYAKSIPFKMDRYFENVYKAAKKYDWHDGCLIVNGGEEAKYYFYSQWHLNSFKCWIDGVE